MSEPCLHCDISQELMPRFRERPALENVHKLCEVIADIAASAAPDRRREFVLEATAIFARLMDEVMSGPYKTDVVASPIPGAEPLQ